MTNKQTKFWRRLLSAILAAVLLAACQSNSAPPIEIRASISPSPIVWHTVTLHAEFQSAVDYELSNITMAVVLPNGVQSPGSGGQPIPWTDDLPGWSQLFFDIPIQVTAPGDWAIQVSVYSNSPTNANSAGFNLTKTLHIHSSATAAEVVQDSEITQVPIPTLQSSPTASLSPILRSPAPTKTLGLVLPTSVSTTLEGEFSVIFGDPDLKTSTVPMYMYELYTDIGESIEVYYDEAYSITSSRWINYAQHKVRLTGKWAPSQLGRTRAFIADSIELLSP